MTRGTGLGAGPLPGSGRTGERMWGTLCGFGACTETWGLWRARGPRKSVSRGGAGVLCVGAETVTERGEAGAGSLGRSLGASSALG